MILAVIPLFVGPLYASYRVKKLKKGILVVLALFVIEFGIFILYGDWKWNEFVDGGLKQHTEITVGFVIALLVEILLQLYFVRKWTLEYNEKIGTSI